MGDEDKPQPPPPSLKKPAPTPPPPDFGKSEAPPQPSPGGAVGSPVPKIIREAPEASEAEVEGPAHGQPAPLNPRLLAGVIDLIAAFGLSLMLVLLLPELLERLAGLVGVGYMLVRDSLPFLKGQSLGKTAMKLKAVKGAGADLTGDWQTAVIRNILMVVPIFGPLIEAVVLVSRDNKRERGLRLGDEWAKTRVIVWRPDEDGDPA